MCIRLRDVSCLFSRRATSELSPSLPSGGPGITVPSHVGFGMRLVPNVCAVCWRPRIEFYKKESRKNRTKGTTREAVITIQKHLHRLPVIQPRRWSCDKMHDLKVIFLLCQYNYLDFMTTLGISIENLQSQQLHRIVCKCTPKSAVRSNKCLVLTFVIPRFLCLFFN